MSTAVGEVRNYMDEDNDRAQGQNDRTLSIPRAHLNGLVSQLSTLVYPFAVAHLCSRLFLFLYRLPA